MRKIKFRGREFNGQWKHGYLGLNPQGNIVIENEKYPLLCYPVQPETVGQFTGLTDQNEKEIYEGDILSDGKGSLGEVRYIERIAQFCIISDDNLWFFNEGNPSRNTKLEYTEVIGNIHDNPDLIKK